MTTQRQEGTTRQLQELIEAHRRRLHKLRLRVAMEGINARPEDLLEIEDIEARIKELEGQLQHLRRTTTTAERTAQVERLEKSLTYNLEPRIGSLEAGLQYFTLNFRFARRDNVRYEILLQSEAGETTGDFVLPFTDEALLYFKLDVYRAIATRGNLRGRFPPILERLKEFGRQLYEAFPGVVKERYQAARDKAVAEGYEGVRLRLTFADPQLVSVPWECLYEPGRDEFFGLSGQVLLVRYTELPYPLIVGFRSPLRILVTIPNPRDLTPLDAGQERERIATALRELETARQVSVHWLDATKSGKPVTLEMLHDVLFAFRPQVLHFIGHGDFDRQRAEGFLFFEGANQERDLISSWRLAQLATSVSSLRLVFLNACQGAETSEVDRLSGVAVALAQKGIPAVIGMQFEITDEAAIEFAAKFYQRLAQGAPVDIAVQEARIHLGVVKGNPVEWATPVLYLLPRDGRVFRLER